MNVHLCMASEKELARLLLQKEDVPQVHASASALLCRPLPRHPAVPPPPLPLPTPLPRPSVPQAVQDKLRTWVKHARAWHKSSGPSWARQEHARGAEWVSSTGQRLTEVSVPGLEAKAEDAVAAPLQREGTDAASRVASRVGGSEAERRRRAMAEIAASRAGKKRPAEGAAASPAPTPMDTGMDVKRSRGEGDGSEAREARERKQARKEAPTPRPDPKPQPQARRCPFALSLPLTPSPTPWAEAGGEGGAACGEGGGGGSAAGAQG